MDNGGCEGLLCCLMVWFIISEVSIAVGQKITNSNDLHCSQPVLCDVDSKFRTMDGSCNNLNDDDISRRWGMSGGMFQRLTDAHYTLSELSRNAPRRSKSSQELPLARNITIRAHTPYQVLEKRINTLHLHFGHFVSNEINMGGLPPSQPGGGCGCKNESNPICCNHNNVHSDTCFTPTIPEADNFHRKRYACFYTIFKRVAITTDARSCIKENHTGKIPERRFVNEVTAYIDASNVYGQNNAAVQKLRKNSGLMRVKELGEGRKPVLPVPVKPGKLRAGHPHAHVTPMLTSIHIIFLREHNRIAKELKRLNPSWDGDRVFEETRRVIGAILQHIVYNEYVPSIIGQEEVKNHGLELMDGFYDGYDESVNPSISLEFSGAAFRMGHSQVPEFVRRGYGARVVPLEKLLLRGISFSAKEGPEGGVDSFISGMLGQRVERVDNKFTPCMRDNLFRGYRKVGGDIVTTNILRGRDFGLPPWMKVRKFCKQPVFSSFSQLFKARIVPTWLVREFEELYEDVGDIDFYSGGVVEKHLPGALVGPTFACIIGKQFERLRKGDRFWYENGNQVGSFTLNQIREIKKVTMASLLCANTDHLKRVQPCALLTPRVKHKKQICTLLAPIAKNKKQNCARFKHLNLSEWKEEDDNENKYIND